MGRDATDGGKSAATEALKARPTGNYVLVGGDQATSVAQNMQKGFHAILDPEVANGNVTIVSDQFTPGWKTEPALAQAENALTKTNDKIDVFLTAYDGMAMGVLQAVAARNLPQGKCSSRAKTWSSQWPRQWPRGAPLAPCGRSSGRWVSVPPRRRLPLRRVSPSHLTRRSITVSRMFPGETPPIS